MFLYLVGAFEIMRYAALVHDCRTQHVLASHMPLSSEVAAKRLFHPVTERNIRQYISGDRNQNGTESLGLRGDDIQGSRPYRWVTAASENASSIASKFQTAM